MKLSFQFALDIIAYCEKLDALKRFVISQQLLKAGTSIGANIREAQSPESRADFLHKLKIALKEAEECEYWLLLCEHATSYPSPKNLLEDLLPIKKILNSSIYTAKRKIG